MKRQSILFVLLLLQVLFICCGCASSGKSAESPAAAAEEAAAVTEEAAVEKAAVLAEASITEGSEIPEEPAAFSLEETAAEEATAEALEEEIIADQKASNAENVEDAVGIFEGLEDNHTAIFSFEGAETAFYFEDPAVQNVLFEAVLGSPYTLSYSYDDSLGYIIYEISE